MVNSFVANGVLQYNALQYPFQLENISNTGVVVRLKAESIEPFITGENCVLVFYGSQADLQVTVPARLVHYSFTLAAFQFIDLDKETAGELESIINKIAEEKNCKAVDLSGLHRHLVIAGGACPVAAQIKPGSY